MELISTSEPNKEKLAKAIVCTIHQPTSDIFQCFSHIILLYHGRCIFQGSAQDAIDHFSKLGFNLPARGFNPADFYLKILSNTPSDDESKYQSFFQRPIEILRESNHFELPCVKSNDYFNTNEYNMWVIWLDDVIFFHSRNIPDIISSQRALWIGQLWLLILRSMLLLRRSYRKIFIDLAWYTVRINSNERFFFVIYSNSKQVMKVFSNLINLLSLVAIFYHGVSL